MTSLARAASKENEVACAQALASLEQEMADATDATVQQFKLALLDSRQQEMESVRQIKSNAKFQINFKNTKK